jgi:hypothetical protein
MDKDRVFYKHMKCLQHSVINNELTIDDIIAAVVELGGVTKEELESMYGPDLALTRLAKALPPSFFGPYDSLSIKWFVRYVYHK